MISWWSKHVGVILSVLMCDIWINVLLHTSALVGPLHIVNWNARWNSEIQKRPVSDCKFTALTTASRGQLTIPPLSPAISFISIVFLYSTCPKKKTFITLFNPFHLSFPFNIRLQNDPGKGATLRSSSYLFSSYIIHALIMFPVPLFFFYCYCTHSLCFSISFIIFYWHYTDSLCCFFPVWPTICSQLCYSSLPFIPCYSDPSQ
jgi:hypothetical protein